MTFNLTPKDKKVIEMFVRGKEAESKKLTSTGDVLHGSWMGGNRIAKRMSNGKIIVRPTTSKADETIENYLKKRGYI